ncbi:DUF3139 domain-containing protein [Bacillus sp. FSL K6-0067]|uniref:DUF3139 domain-containing protein n=1 Tax=Bacillus sp. FSL K6-0067 TaxID=2921412 RepID=UPI00077ADB15|nr:DUF3139 domain-containing protein [Bacillus cereus]KXY10991.1 hypothetical protein AT267_00910 [Bacillus cereus]
MSKKMIVLLVIIGSFLSYGVYDFCVAKYHVNKYIEQQGIKKEDIVIESHSRHWNGYAFHITVKGEDPNIYYEYKYIADEVMFFAFRSNKDVIAKNIWAGSGLSEEEEKQLKYPPLHLE